MYICINEYERDEALNIEHIEHNGERSVLVTVKD